MSTTERTDDLREREVRALENIARGIAVANEIAKQPNPSRFRRWLDSPIPGRPQSNYR